jgi:hypothetical protein
MTAHTPGPWKIGAYESGQMAVDGANGEEVTGFIEPEDARLIAAAPELLEALDKIACFAPGNGDVCEIIAKVARAAIAKATAGEA